MRVAPQAALQSQPFSFNESSLASEAPHLLGVGRMLNYPATPAEEL